MQEAQSSVQPVGRFDARVVIAFALIYIVWGSTFLAIRYAIESIPPFLTIGFRSAGAGALLYVWVLLKGDGRLSWREWRIAAIGGFCFFVLCHGSLAWAETRVPTGVAAVIMALIPVWVVLVDWLRPGGTHPGKLVLLGVAIGFSGLVILVGPQNLRGNGTLDLLAVVVLVLSALGWALGTVYSRYAAPKASPVATSAMQLLTGGAMLLLASAFSGDWNILAASTTTARSIWALIYLIVVGSVITFSAYIWLLRVTSPSRVATYAYVNPVVAVALGWAFAGEAITQETVLGTVVVVVGVILITTYQRRPGQKQTVGK